MSDLIAQHEKKRLEEHTKRLKEKLRELFQMGDIAEDLDFGMYRIVHQKRKEVEEFINTTLGRTVDEAFGTYTEAARAGIVSARDTLERTIREEIDESALGPEGILPQFLNTKKGRELNEQWKQLRSDESRATMSDQHKAEIFAHVAEFFSRYYKDGDFLSLPRYSKQEKYAIPYNGEEVMLHWANKDQYYIKTDLWLNNYVFDAGVFKVVFEVCRADNSVNTTNDKELVFILSRGDEAVAFERDAKVLTLRFVRTKWNADEMGQFLPEGANREKPSKEHLREAIVQEALSNVIDDGLKAALNRRAYPDRADIQTTIFQKHVNQFTTENTSDFFIHKDLKGFLTRELDFYLKNEVINLDDLGTDREVSLDDLQQYMTRARIIKQISTRIIDFLAQLEEFQKMLFEKKKFVLATDYCMTIDYVPEEFFEEILSNSKQLAEWKTLFGAGEEEQATLVAAGRGITREYLKANPHLVLDTKFFDAAFKERLLVKLKRPDGSPLQDLDAEICSVLFHSENWQALNLIKEKYEESVKCIYIDPPYNTGNDEFLYHDSYQHSSWLSMMYDRIGKSKEFLLKNGVLFCSIDDNEITNINKLLPLHFGTSIINYYIQVRYLGKTLKSDSDYQKLIESVICGYNTDFKPIKETEEYTLNKFEWKIVEKTSTPIKIEIGSHPAELFSENEYEIQKVAPNIDALKEVWASGTILTGTESGRIFNNFIANRVETDGLNVLYKVYGVGADGLGYRYFTGPKRAGATKGKYYSGIPLDKREAILSGNSVVKENPIANFYNYADSFGNCRHEGGVELRSGKKPEKLLEMLLKLSTVSEDLVLDYFGGTGTTFAVSLKMGRKSISVEMNEEFFSKKLIIRVKNVLNGERTGVSQDYNWQGGGIVKYQTLEQYEDALDNIVFRQPDGTIARTLSGFSDYMLHYMLGFETRGSPCRLNTDALKKPFDYTLRIRRRKLDQDHLKCSSHDDGSNTWLDAKVDLIETFNYLLGLHVLRIAAYDENGLHYHVIHGRTRDNGTVTIVWRNSPEGEEGLKADERFINERIKHDFPASILYINGQFFVRGAEHIEPKFRELMGA